MNTVQRIDAELDKYRNELATLYKAKDRLLEEYCLKRFKERPRFVETIGKVGTEGAKIWNIYKKSPKGDFQICIYYLCRTKKGLFTTLANFQK